MGAGDGGGDVLGTRGLLLELLRHLHEVPTTTRPDPACAWARPGAARTGLDCPGPARLGPNRHGPDLGWAGRVASTPRAATGGQISAGLLLRHHPHATPT